MVPRGCAPDPCLPLGPSSTPLPFNSTLASGMKATSSAIVILVVAVALLFAAWFAGLAPGRLVTAVNQNSMAQTYTQALARGHASIGIEPDARLLSSPDPFARQNMVYHPIDSSFYRGRFYLYFGIVPFALLLVPWTLLTRTLVTDNAAVVGLLAIGYVMYGSSLWIAFNRRGKGSLVRLAVAACAMIVCSGTLSLLARTAIYEIEEAAAYALFAAAVLCLVIAGEFPRRRTAALAVAVLLAALTVGCRPNYIPAAALVGAWSVLQAWTAGGSRMRRAALVASPLVLVGTCLAAWNYVRFSNPLEFGLSYIFFQHSQPQFSELSAGNVLYNAHRYLIGGFRIGDYFPFVDGMAASPIALPPHHEEMYQVYGCLLMFPILAWAAVPVWGERGLGGLRRPSTLLALAALSNFALLTLIGFGTYRYLVDFLGILAFVAALGIALPAPPGSAPLRIVSAVLLSLVFAWSACLGLFEAVSIARTASLFDEVRPLDFARMARPFNRLAYAAERLSGNGPRYVRLDLRFPGSASGIEPLLVTGEPGAQDFLYVYYAGPGLIQLGFEAMGHGGPVSAYLPVDRGASHVLDIDLGSFLPPADHPLMAAVPRGQRPAAYPFIHVALDGATVLDAPAELHPVRGRIRVGESPDEDSFGRAFTGRILRVDRPRVADVGLFPDWNPGMFGPLREEVELAAAAPGTAEPLVSAGYRHTGGVLLVRRLGESRVRLEWVDFGGHQFSSAPFAWDYDRPHSVEASFGSLLPPVGSALWGSSVPEEGRQALKRQFRCAVDGVQVWDQEIETPEASPYSVAVGENALTLGESRARLSGRILSAGRLPWGSASGSPAPAGAR